MYNMIKEKYIPTSKKKTKFSWNGQGIILQYRGWLVEFSDGKGEFYNGNESDNSDNDDENYNENNEQ